MGLLSEFFDFIFGRQPDKPGKIVTLDYKSPSGGYTNYAVFSVKGINSATNRKKTNKYKCKTEDEAIELAMQDGLVKIESVHPIPFSPPSDAQIQACDKYGHIIPPGACHEDVGAIMTKEIYDEDDSPFDLMKCADFLGVRFSYFDSKQCLLHLISDIDDNRTVAAFYYSVFLNRGDSFFSKCFLTLQNNKICYDFADVVCNDNRVMASIRKSIPSATELSYGTVAYKAASEFKQNGSI